MELDKKILPGRKPLDCYDIEEAKQFIGKKGYFFENIYSFSDIKADDLIFYANLTAIDEQLARCFYDDCDSKHYYFLPEEWVKEPETKFVPYTLDTWEQDFKPGDMVFFRGKEDTPKAKNYYKCMYLGHLENENNRILIILGCWLFAFDELINSYEIFRNEKWEPFGREVQE